MIQHAIADELCAVVKIEIRQELTLERQAFDAHMRITNGLDTLALQDVSIDVWFQDEDQQPVLASSDAEHTTALFFIRPDEMTGINDIGGSGVVQPGGVANIHWLIIPAFGAGGESPSGELYFVGATLSYTLGGEPETITVAPDFIVVRPMPLLRLDYFLPEEVIGNDPSTPEQEPSEPFELGVRVTNAGFGAAKNLAIESAQPEIIDNDQGLLIHFEILDTQVNDQPVANTLLASFGDLPAGESTVAVWRMISSLYGHFHSFEADYYHSDELGGELTSLLEGVTTHTLIRSVYNDLPGRDAVRDFLARDGDTLRLYESQGMNTDVSDVSPEAVLSWSGSAGDTQYYDLDFPATVGPLYLVLADPPEGEGEISGVWRSDGKHIALTNVWQSRSKSSGSWENLLHLFDTNSTGEYEVRFSSDMQPNRPPVLAPVNNSSVSAGMTAHRTFMAADPDNDPLVFALDPVPPGATFTDGGEGVAWLEWPTQISDVGEHQFLISVSDGEFEDSQSFWIDVLSPFLPGIVVEAGTLPLVTTESGKSAYFDIRLGSPPTDEVWIPLASSDESEGVVAVDGVWFAPADWDVPQSIEVYGVDDDVFDGDVEYEILIGPAVSLDSVYDGMPHPPLPALNIDNEEPMAILSPSTGLTTAGADTRAWMEVSLNGAPSAPVTITLASTQTQFGIPDPAVISLDAGNWNIPVQVEIQGQHPLVPPGPDVTPYEIQVAEVESADDNFHRLEAASVEVLHHSGVTWGLEAGVVELPSVMAGMGWRYVEFAQPFKLIPAVVFLPDDTAPDPASVRIRNVSLYGFELIQTEPLSSYSGTGETTVHYLAIEPITSRLPGGGYIEVHSISTQALQTAATVIGSWDEIEFNVPFGSAPVLLANIQSDFNEAGTLPEGPSVPWLTTTVSHLSASGFSVALERSGELVGAVSQPETIGYVAISPGTQSFATNTGWADWDGESDSALAGPWDDGCQTYDWFERLEGDQVLLAGKVTRNSRAGGWLRLCMNAFGEHGLLVDQDVSSTSERGQFDEETRALRFSKPFQTRLLWDPIITVPPISQQEGE